MATLVDPNAPASSGSSFNWQSLIDPITNVVGKVVDYEIFKKTGSTAATAVPSPVAQTAVAGDTGLKKYLVIGAIAAAVVAVGVLVFKLIKK